VYLVINISSSIHALWANQMFHRIQCPVNHLSFGSDLSQYSTRVRRSSGIALIVSLCHSYLHSGRSCEGCALLRTLEIERPAIPNPSRTPIAQTETVGQVFSRYRHSTS